MDEKKISDITSGDVKLVKPALEELFQKYSPLLVFPELNQNNLRLLLWEALFNCVTNPNVPETHILCLLNIRILSRDKSQLEDIMNEKWIDVLLEIAECSICQPKLLDHNLTDDMKIESLKCLCNLVHNSKVARDLCVKKGTIEKIMSHIRKFLSNKTTTHMDIKNFSARLLFILTAHYSELRDALRTTHNGLFVLVEFLDNELKCVPAPSELDNTVINDSLLNLLCEILKVIFNIIIQKSTDDDNKENDCLDTLVIICKSLLLFDASSNEKKNLLHNDVVNILTCLEPAYYKNLSHSAKLDSKLRKRFKFDETNIASLFHLLEFLKYKLSITEHIEYQNENLAPILTVVFKAAMCCSTYRKYLRSIVLPPLKNVHERPEVGNTIRNQLCRLLTTPVTHVRDLAANFLFVLCKENVGRMIKYTGYGNAAGLFATKGLLGLQNQNAPECQYSSDSEDSDTEEYLAMRHTVNPVTGCYEPPRTDPMAGCTEEQKEYEAMKLVNLMDQLNRAGVIKPCRVGADGKLEPVEHILQLQEELPNQQLQNKREV